MSNPADQDQRRLPPTEKRIRDFRREGRIALSRDLHGVAAMSGGAILGLSLATSSLGRIQSFAGGVFGNVDRLSSTEVLPALGAAFSGAALPAIGGALAGALVSTAGQLGFPPAFARLRFDPSRLFAPQAVAQILAPKAAAGRALKSTAKLLTIVAAGAIGLHAEWQRFLADPALEPTHLLPRLVSASLHVTLWAGLPLAALAVLDFALARRRIQAQMRMTPEELKRELREQEGDPAIKRRRRQRMKELTKRRVVAAVKSADVVVVNPTEFAVALRYRSKRDRAPRVVAKGKGHSAEHIRELARGFGVPIVPNIPLARFLFKAVPEGRTIPAEVYRAVAEIIAYVYRIQRRGPR
ncbi:MAG: EscU/YscU/HrcU family type III secretion system export apparatus switch protein [Deltaproteobacteria bacterium]|nr:EscU/YscU/HrcU family type III secretion system export apparatus switch protein [Deltaproteobacteria bacterium]